MHSGQLISNKSCTVLLKAGLMFVLFLLSIFQASAAETISINRDNSALDLTEAVSIFRDRGETFQVTTAPDAEGIVRTIEVQANNPETAGDWAVLVLGQ